MCTEVEVVWLARFFPARRQWKITEVKKWEGGGDGGLFCVSELFFCNFQLFFCNFVFAEVLVK